jgi:hypothetical protein
VTNTVQEKLDQYPMFDQAIVEHGFSRRMRDYEIVVLVPAPYGGGKEFTQGTYLYRFTHCVLAETATALDAEVWRRCWDDESLDDEYYVWSSEHADAYPGLSYVADSPRAESWAQRLGRPMHEIVIETNAYNIRLIFHDVVIRQIAQGDPHTGTLTPR